MSRCDMVTGMTAPQTLFDKIWDEHTVSERDDGQTLVYVDRLYTQENSYHAYQQLRRAGRSVRRPDQVFSFADHYVPTKDCLLYTSPSPRDS